MNSSRRGSTNSLPKASHGVSAWRWAPDLNDVLPAITAPVAVICGDKDPSSPPSVMTPIADAMTGTSADMTVVFDCGHFSAYEHPQAVADALLALVRRVQ